MMPGLTVVVSPLLALMQDQLAALKGKQILASSISSLNSAAERRDVMADLEAIANPAVTKLPLKMLYVTPETLTTKKFLDVLKPIHKLGRLSFFGVDEAHCISHWGHDFRPSFLRLRKLKLMFPDVKIMACTATATDTVKGDVIRQLGLEDPEEFAMSFNRPNIEYEVRYKSPDHNAADEDIIAWIQWFMASEAAEPDEDRRKRRALTGVTALSHHGYDDASLMRAHLAQMPKAVARTANDAVEAERDAFRSDFRSGEGSAAPENSAGARLEQAIAESLSGRRADQDNKWDHSRGNRASLVSDDGKKKKGPTAVWSEMVKVMTTFSAEDVRRTPAGIVYCHRKSSVDRLVKSLVEAGLPAGAYHADMRDSERAASLIAWMENRVKIMVATVAFGMGVDKPDVRFVIHRDIPKR